MSSQASSSSTSAEHPCGWSALSESCIVRIFQRANLRLVETLVFVFFSLYEIPIGQLGHLWEDVVGNHAQSVLR